MKFILLDREEKYLGILKDVIKANHLEELNGQDILEIQTLDQRAEKGFRILYKSIYGYWNEFIIKGIESLRKDGDVIIEVYCESSLYETLGDYVDDKRPYDTTANIALENALLTTRWEVGQVDDLGINSINFYHISAKEAIQKTAETWQGDIRTRVIVQGNKITKRYVDLLNNRGNDSGKRFTYSKDLLEITKIVHREDVVTALYGYGKGEEIEDEEGQATGGFGRRIDFSDINNGKAYVENNDARLIWGRNNPDGTKSHIFSKVEFDDIEDKQLLLEMTMNKLEEMSTPLITYQANVIDLKAYGLEHEGVELGDRVIVIDKEFDPVLRLKSRVIQINRDLLEPQNNEIVLGNFIPNLVDDLNKQNQYINSFRDKQGVWDRSSIINPDKTLDANYLKDMADALNSQINADGGYTYFTEGEGFITYDKPIDQDPTMAIQIKGGSIRIANSKKPNGDWDWQTFGTGDGFVANHIITGLLQGGKVKFDLTNGTLLIGDSVEDYLLLFDGHSLKINLANGKSIEETIDDLDVTGRNLILNSRETKVTWQQYKNYTWEEVMV